MAVLDWRRRRMLVHRVSITMKADFCAQAAVGYGTPEIVNT